MSRFHTLHLGEQRRLPYAGHLVGHCTTGAIAMPQPRKKPTSGFWITVAIIAVLVGYPLSFGPACGLADNRLLPFSPIEFVFRPIVRFMMNGPNPVVRRAIIGYASICGGEGTALRLDSDWWWEHYDADGSVKTSKRSSPDR